MGYAKKCLDEMYGTDYLVSQINVRVLNMRPYGSGGEGAYIDSMFKLVKLLRKEDNLFILQTLNEALSKMIKCAAETWPAEWAVMDSRHDCGYIEGERFCHLCGKYWEGSAC